MSKPSPSSSASCSSSIVLSLPPLLFDWNFPLPLLLLNCLLGSLQSRLTCPNRLQFQHWGFLGLEAESSFFVFSVLPLFFWSIVLIFRSLFLMFLWFWILVLWNCWNWRIFCYCSIVGCCMCFVVRIIPQLGQGCFPGQFQCFPQWCSRRWGCICRLRGFAPTLLCSFYG